MKDEPNIVKELREAENPGLFQSKVQGAYEELEVPKEASEESLDKTTYMVDGDLKRARDDIEIENIGEKYRTIFENYAIAITMADEKERIVSWNKYAEELLSMSEKDLYLKPVSSLYPSEEWKKIRAENIRKKGIKYRMETKMIRNNQELFDVELSLCVLKGVKGKTVCSIGIIKDITKQKEMKKALEKSEGKFRQLYEKAPVPYHTLSPLGTITNVNETWCQTLGYSRKEVIGRSIFDFVIEDEKKSSKSSFEKKILSKQSYSTANERVYVTKDGEERILAIHDFFSFDGDNNVESVYTIMNDVTELKKVEEEMKKHQGHLEKLVDERTAELKKINERIQQESMTLVQAEKEIRSTAAYTRSLIEASLDPLVTIGSNGMITDVNESTEKITGRIRKELIGSDFSGYFTEPAKAKEGYKQVFEKGVVRDYPLELRHKNGGITSVLYNASVYKDESGKVVGVFAAARDVTKHKHMEEVIQESEKKFRSLIETTSDWMWEVDKNGVYTYASPKVKDLLGYEPEEIMGKTPFDLMAPGEVERVAKIFQDIIKKQKPFTALENTNLHKDGRHVVLETSGEPFFDADENLLGYCGIDRDITERKKADEGLKVSEGKYKVLFNASPEMIHQVDANGAIVATNPIITRTLGYSQQEVIGKKLSDIFTDSSKKIFDGKFPELAKKGYDEGEVEMVCKDGTTKNVFCSRTALYDENNNFNGGVFYQHDITKERKAQELIKQSEERYRTMFESANDGIIIIGKKGGMIDINQTTSDLFGRSREEYIGKNLKEAMHLFTKRSQARILKNFALRMLGKHILPYEVEMYMPEGEIKTVEINAVPLKRDEKVYGDLAILRDVTFRKKAEESLKENEERLRVVLGSVKEGITFSDESGKFEVFNPEIERLTGYSIEDANAHPDFSKLLYPDSKEQNKALDGLNKLTKTGDIYETETRIKTKDGKFRDLLVSTTIVYHQDKKMFLSDYCDISEHKRLTKEMKIKDNAIDSSVNGIAIVDLNGNVTYVNQSFIKMWGYDDANSLISEPFDKFLQKKGRSITILDELIGKKTFIDELVAERKDGSFFDVQFSASVVSDDNDKPICMMASSVDISNEKKLQGELKEKINNLEVYKESTVDREIKMVELKKEINNLYEKLGEEPKYVLKGV